MNQSTRLEGKTLPVYGDASNVRELLHVSDHGERALIDVIAGPFGRPTMSAAARNATTSTEFVARFVMRPVLRLRGRPKRAERFPSCPAAEGRLPARSLIAFVTHRLPCHDQRYAIKRSKTLGRT